MIADSVARGGRVAARAIPALALAALPKCPACLAMYLGLAGVVPAPWFTGPALYVAALVLICAVLWTGRSGTRAAVSVLWLAGLITIVTARELGNGSALLGGAVLVVAAAVWQACSSERYARHEPGLMHRACERSTRRSTR